ncbi:hypothetical protein M422DRAFT_34483 [Sphaerobolus stellatus SS14]|uniref:F-box domain-containing protein n=1 Tax=Sphaerobolus stellatus (strain SS14) TaxID=990650 RepID=A0A0C9ULS7_SPHS4|nr:hypothetical protein M422DRAFT_34483 [Sphaerobolus stellatus SS14]
MMEEHQYRLNYLLNHRHLLIHIRVLSVRYRRVLRNLHISRNLDFEKWVSILREMPNLEIARVALSRNFEDDQRKLLLSDMLQKQQLHTLIFTLPPCLLSSFTSPWAVPAIKSSLRALRITLCPYLFGILNASPALEALSIVNINHRNIEIFRHANLSWKTLKEFEISWVRPGRPNPTFSPAMIAPILYNFEHWKEMNPDCLPPLRELIFDIRPLLDITTEVSWIIDTFKGLPLRLLSLLFIEEMDEDLFEEILTAFPTVEEFTVMRTYNHRPLKWQMERLCSIFEKMEYLTYLGCSNLSVYVSEVEEEDETEMLLPLAVIRACPTLRYLEFFQIFQTPTTGTQITQICFRKDINGVYRDYFKHIKDLNASPPTLCTSTWRVQNMHL